MMLLFIGACGNSKSEEKTSEVQDSTEKGKFYDLFFRIEDVSSRHVVTVNGFPVEEQNVMSRATHDQYGIDLNTALIGDGNEVQVRMIPYLEPSGEGLDVGTIEYTAEVQSSTTWETHGGVPVEGAEIIASEVDTAYKAWKKRAEEQWTEYRSTVQKGAADSMRAWASRHPMTVSTTFDNKRGPDFSRVFEEAPRLPDTPATRERLRDYAMRLRDLMAEKDTTALYKEAQPLFTDRDTGEPASRERILEIIGSNWFARDWQLDFTREEVGLRRWSGGRVWELYQKESGEEFFVGENGTSVLDIYVAEIGGDLTVVR
jgi:hypothetical protein